jgi:hypothetical protein
MFRKDPRLIRSLLGTIFLLMRREEKLYSGGIFWPLELSVA